jgi:hypothetical protein
VAYQGRPANKAPLYIPVNYFRDSSFSSLCAEGCTCVRGNGTLSRSLCTHAAGGGRDALGWPGAGPAEQRWFSSLQRGGYVWLVPRQERQGQAGNGDCVMARVAATLGSSSCANFKLKLELCHERARAGGRLRPTNAATMMRWVG